MDKKLKQSYYNIRTSVGVLGILLPVLLYFINGSMLPSVSHYYYSKASFVFSAIIFSFSLFLITYKGYEKDKSEKLSDNLLTNLAGLLALFVLVFPTACKIPGLCADETIKIYVFGRGNEFISLVHYISSGLFFILMGGMSFFKFARGANDRYRLIYKILGLVMWASIAWIGILSLFFHVRQIFIYEAIVLWAFGISWLLKGKFLFKL